MGFTYDDASRRDTATLPNGINVNYGYDNADHITSIVYSQNGTTIGDLTYSYDAVGNRTSVGGSWARTGLPQSLSSATYDAANRIVIWGGTTVNYDANGNLTSVNGTSYVWNARNQLTNLIGEVTASFLYDGFGRRRAKTVTGTTTEFLHDLHNPVQELTLGTPSANLLGGLAIDELFVRSDGSSTSHYLTDALGSSVALADASGNVQTSYTYEPFGGTIANGAASPNSYAFTGRELDGGGTFFYRARYYDSKLQRFVSSDPLDFTCGEINLYTYTGNSPTNLTDPMGTCPACVGLIIRSPGVVRGAAAALQALITQMANAAAHHKLSPRCQKQWEDDWKRCAQETSNRQAYAKCMTQAAERASACIRGKQLPPFFPDEPWGPQ